MMNYFTESDVLNAFKVDILKSYCLLWPFSSGLDEALMLFGQFLGLLSFNFLEVNISRFLYCFH